MVQQDAYRRNTKGLSFSNGKKRMFIIDLLEALNADSRVLWVKRCVIVIKMIVIYFSERNRWLRNYFCRSKRDCSLRIHAEDNFKHMNLNK